MKKLIFIMILFSGLIAGPTKYYFYNPQIKYGSELIFNPLHLIVNGGFDILRNGGHDKNIFNQEYEKGINNVFRNITNPLKNIEKFGWSNFMEREVLPKSLSVNKGQFVPNYAHHLIGGGMLYVRTAEWYDYQGFEFPYTASFFTTFFYQITNEVLENGGYSGTNVDPIADLLIFNPIGKLLFSFDAVKRFFSKTLPIYDWSLQPVINPLNGRLENAGEQFALKYPIPFIKKYSFFVYWGIYGLGGISYKRNDGNSFSFALGKVVNKLKENLIDEARFMTPGIDGAMGFFWDKNNSLMSSLVITGPNIYNAQINIYPGIFKFGFFTPGFYCGFGEWDGFLIGASIAHVPVGLVTGSYRR